VSSAARSSRSSPPPRGGRRSDAKKITGGAYPLRGAVSPGADHVDRIKHRALTGISTLI
jgi:hypothetical protein